MTTCLLCKKPKRLQARGLCMSCYTKAWRLGMLNSFPRYTPKYTDRHAYWRAYYQAHKAERRKSAR